MSTTEPAEVYVHRGGEDEDRAKLSRDDAAPAREVRGCWLATTDGTVIGVGDAQHHGGIENEEAQVVAISAPTDGSGYWLATADGRVWSFGAVTSFTLADEEPVTGTVVELMATQDGAGYYLVTAEGAVRAQGSAQWAGSALDAGLSAPVVGADSCPGGYWLACADGRILSFGTAQFEGSASEESFDDGSQVVGLMAHPTGAGYWVLAADGRVFAYGVAPFLGRAEIQDTSVVGGRPTPDGEGYWLCCADGTIHAFGRAIGFAAVLDAIAPGESIVAMALS